MKIKNFTLTLCFLTLLFLNAQAQHKVKAIDNAGENISSNSISELVQFNGKLHFIANSQTNYNSYGLYAYDAATESLDTIIPPTPNNEMSELTYYDNRLCFSGKTPDGDIELYVYDGTNAPVLMDLYTGTTSSTSSGGYGVGIGGPSVNSSNPRNFKVANGVLYFSANGGQGHEFWKYDGTTAVQIMDIYPGEDTNGFFIGTTPQNSSNPSKFTAYNGNIYFSANGPSGVELYEYDGLAVNLVMDMKPGFYNGGFWGSGPQANGSNPQYLTVYNNKLYFNGNDGTTGNELYYYDGTGIYLEEDLYPGNNTFISYPNPEPYNGADPRELTIMNGKLYFNATNDAYGRELWEFDGTDFNLVADINTNTDSYGGGVIIWTPLNTNTSDSNPYGIVLHDGKLYFNANDGNNGPELFMYDGINSPCMIKDYIPGESGIAPEIITSLGDQLYFKGRNEDYETMIYGFRRIFVDINETTNGDGKSWDTPFNSLQSALDVTTNNDELWLTGGTYTPTKDHTGNANPTDNRMKTFYINKSISIFGGFNGTECSMMDRDWQNNKTILSADLDNDDTKDADGLVQSANDIIGNNAYHGIWLDGVCNESSRLDGLYITGGKANGANYPHNGGAAILNSAIGMNALSQPIFSDVILVGNHAGHAGGAIMNYADEGEALLGIDGVLFQQNSAGFAGALLANVADNNGTSTINILNTAFSDIDAAPNGPVLYSYAANGGTSTPTFINCVFKNNMASANGGVVYGDNNNGTSNPTFINTTFYGNSAASGHVLYNANGATATFTNSIIWENGMTGPVLFTNGTNMTLNHTILQGGDAALDAGDSFSTTGTNIQEDPMFTDAANGILTVQICSPAINGGKGNVNNEDFDIQGNIRLYNYGNIDLGAFEFQGVPNNNIGLATDYAAVERVFPEYGDAHFVDDCTSLLASLFPTGVSPVYGTVKTEVWIESAVPTILGNPFVARHYQITPELNASTAEGYLTLYFTQAEFDAFNNHPMSVDDLPTDPSDATGIANLRIAKRSGSSADGSGLPNTYSGDEVVIDPNDNDIIWNASENRWEITILVGGFSGFFVNTGASVLPVELTYFNAEKDGRNALLTWGTASEENNMGFHVERSSNGFDFERIGWVDGMGTTAEIQEYEYTDEKPLAGINYYRLTQEDFDGTTDMTDIRFVEFDAWTDVQVFPNPAVKGETTTVKFHMLQSQNVQIQIMDATGRSVWASEVNLEEGTQTIDIPTHMLSKGIYMIHLNDGQANSSLKLSVVE